MKENEFNIIFNKISDENHLSEICLYINGENICLFKLKDDNTFKTTRWNLDELVLYLKDLYITLYNDEPFPFEVEGECAAELDNNARYFDIEDHLEFEKYYTVLNEWGYKHSWHHACSGAILADVFFRKVDNKIEISWWSGQDEEDVIFKYKYGFVLIPIDDFFETLNKSVNSYNNLWL